MENENEILKSNKSKRKSNILSAILIIFFIIASFFAGYFVSIHHTYNILGNIPLSKIAEINRIEDLIKNNYYTNYDKNKLYTYAEECMVMGLEDPYSYFLDETSNNEYEKDIMGNYVGIGLTLTPGDNGEILVLSPFDGSPAQKAGIKAGDILYKVNGKEYTYDGIDEAVSVMRGKKGEKVTLELKRKDSENIIVEVTKDNINVASVTSKKISENIICIRISRFDITTADDFNAEMKKYDINPNMHIILDLRDNPGGVVDSALKIADVFLNSGTIMTEKYKNEDDVVNKADKQISDNAYPIVILANKNSASASEIVTGALTDNKKAVLIGETTYGKGILNQKFPVSDKTALVLSVGEYTTPSGKSIHKKGIKPDIEVQIAEEYKKIAVSDLTVKQDAQLQKAIEYITKGVSN